jgi:hypothetical protein
MIFSISLFGITLIATVALLGRQIVQARKQGINTENNKRDVNRNFLAPIKRNIYHFLGVLKKIADKYVLKSAQATLSLFWGYLRKKTTKARIYINNSHYSKEGAEKNSEFLGSLENHKDKVNGGPNQKG